MYTNGQINQKDIKTYKQRSDQKGITKRKKQPTFIGFRIVCVLEDKN